MRSNVNTYPIPVTQGRKVSAFDPKKPISIQYNTIQYNIYFAIYTTFTAQDGK